MKKIEVGAVAAAVFSGVCSAAMLELPSSVTWTDLSALDSYDGVTVAAGQTLTLNLTADCTLAKPIAGDGGVVKTGAGALTITAANSFKGAFAVNQGFVYAENDAAFGTTDGKTTIASADQTGVIFKGIATGESFDISGSNKDMQFRMASGTVNTISGDVTFKSGTVNVYAESNAKVYFNGAVSGSTVRYETITGSEIVFNGTNDAYTYNQSQYSGRLVFNVPYTGERFGYTGNLIVCGDDFVFDGQDDLQLGAYYYANPRLDLCGHPQRVASISWYNTTTIRTTYSTVTSADKAFLHVNNSDTGISRVQFLARAGLCWEGSGTVTMTNVNTSAGDITVMAGTVKFCDPAVSSWVNADIVTVGGGRLELDDVEQLGTPNLVLNGDGVIKVPAGKVMKVKSLKVNGAEQVAKTYTSADFRNIEGGSVEVSPTAGDLVLDATEGDIEYPAANLSQKVTRIIKIGSHTATLTGEATDSAAVADFVGTIEIREGVLAATMPAYFGAPSQVTITPGATWDISPAVANSTAHGKINTAKIVMGGTGVAGTGAIRRLSGGNANTINLLGSFELTADTLIGATGSISFNGKRDLKGFKLTKTGGGQMYVSGSSVTAGTIESNAGNFNFWGATTYEPNVRFIHSGATVLLNASVPNTVSYENTLATTLTIWSDGPVWNGPMYLPYNLTVREDKASYNSSIVGPITATNTLFQVSQATRTGTLTIGGNTNHIFSKIGVCGGTVAFRDAGYVSMPSNTLGSTAVNVQVAKDQGVPATLELSGRTTLVNTEVPPNTAQYGSITVAYDSGTYGLVRIGDGAVVSNDFHIGFYGQGAVHQSGGEVFWNSQGNRGARLGGWANGSYGCYGITGGKMRINTNIFHSWEKGSVGILAVKGGLYDCFSNTGLKTGDGYSGVYVSGDGQCRTDRGYLYANWFEAGKNDGGVTEFSVNGTNALLTATLIQIGQKPQASTTSIAIKDGGTLTLNALDYRPGNAATRLYVNCNGGVLKPNMQRQLFATAEASNKVADQMTLYGKGLVVDTSLLTVDKPNYEINTTLKLPTQKTIKSITLPAEALEATKYVGPARITISGDGVGAQATVDFDETTRKATGVTVVSPGTGFSGDATVTVNDPFRTTSWPCTVEMEDADASGGVTKRGTGTLVFSAAQEYRGVTRAEGGSILFSAEGSYQGGDLELAGGEIVFPRDTTLDCTIRGTCADLFGGQTRVTCTGTLTFGPNARFVVTDPENLSDYRGYKRVKLFTATTAIIGRPAVSVGEGNNFGLGGSGRYLSFGFNRGMILVVQ